MKGGCDLLSSVRGVFDHSVGIGPAAGYMIECVYMCEYWISKRGSEAGMLEKMGPRV